MYKPKTRRIRIALALLACGVLAVAATVDEKLPLEAISNDSKSLNEQHYNIFTPENPNGKAIVICPGGGYVFLATQHEGTDFAKWLSDKGFLCLVLEYRFPQGNHEIPLDDATKAVRYLREHANEYSIDPHQIGIMGFSAGGHLAATTATLSTPDSRPDFQILMYPVISMADEITHHGSKTSLLGATPPDSLVERFSAEKQVTSGTPRALIILSSDDTVVDPENSLRYYRALRDNNVPASMHIYPSGGHGWGFNDGFRYKDAMLQELDSWLTDPQTTE